jgi:transposase
VILPGGRFQVFVATKPVDFRKGMDSLAAVVQERLRLDPFSGAVFVGIDRAHPNPNVPL